MTRIHPFIMTLLCLFVSAEALAVDSYRYLHVTIDTPWAIFIFLLPIVLSPFILMAILYWRFAKRREDTDEEDDLDQAMEKNEQQITDKLDDNRPNKGRSSDNG